MAFRLKAEESVSHGIKRNVRGELDKALKHLRDHEPDEAVHEARKSLKKVRAALRLVRADLGDAVYRQENYALRDAARRLSALRDAMLLVEAFDMLRERFAQEMTTTAFDEVRQALLANHEEVSRRALNEERTINSAAEEIERSIARVEDWTIENEGWSALGDGVRRIYRAGYRGLAACKLEPSVENLHEWRKQTKYHWHQLQLLELAWTGRAKELCDQARELTRRLGADHDLAVFREAITMNPLGYGGHRPLKSLLPLIDGHRKALQGEAFRLARDVYREPPKDFTTRLERDYESWASEEAGKIDESPPATGVGGHKR